MKWREFSSLIHNDKCANRFSEKGKLSDLFSKVGNIETTNGAYHDWYPKGVKNQECYKGHRYVDINHSYFGAEPLLISEASCCILVLCLDTQSENRFAAHISACSDVFSKQWFSMAFDLQCFFKNMINDIHSAEVYLFSDQLYKGEDGTFEHKNLMRLLSSALSKEQLENLAPYTHLIEGEDGNSWNPLCAVRSNHYNKSHVLDISFAVP